MSSQGNQMDPPLDSFVQSKVSCDIGLPGWFIPALSDKSNKSFSCEYLVQMDLQRNICLTN